MPPILSLLRPHQWIKNAFVAAPLFFTPKAISWPSIIHVVLGVVCFSAMASAVYVLNDWRDREADRIHPDKRLRPLAAGTVTMAAAAVLALGLALGSGAIAAIYFPLRVLVVLAL